MAPETFLKTESSDLGLAILAIFRKHIPTCVAPNTDIIIVLKARDQGTRRAMIAH